MKTSNSVAFVTGANRGLGRAIVLALQAAGARRVYAAARDPASIELPGVVPVALDVTDPQQVAAAVQTAGDVNLLINNAGISRGSGLLQPQAVEALQAEFATNVLGPLALARAFAPVLARNGGGTIVNVLSVLSWLTLPGAATYSVSKAAAWSVTNGLRNELRAQDTKVVGVHIAFMDTDMASKVAGPKAAPDDVARQILEAVEAGRPEVLADEVTRQVKRALSDDVAPPYLGVPA